MEPTHEPNAGSAHPTDTPESTRKLVGVVQRHAPTWERETGHDPTPALATPVAIPAPVRRAPRHREAESRIDCTAIGATAFYVVLFFLISWFVATS